MVKTLNMRNSPIIGEYETTLHTSDSKIYSLEWANDNAIASCNSIE